MMILIADCGSTKINWTLLNGKEKEIGRAHV